MGVSIYITPLETANGNVTSSCSLFTSHTFPHKITLQYLVCFLDHRDDLAFTLDRNSIQLDTLVGRLSNALCNLRLETNRCYMN